MQFLRERLGLVLLVGVVAALLLYSLHLAQAARDPRFAPKPLSYSQHRYGVKGFARLLERNGYTVRSLKRTHRRLPKDAEMLVIFPPPFRLDGGGDWSAEDADALDAWLRKGGRLLLFSEDTRLPDSLRGDARNRLPIAQFPTDRQINAQPILPAPWLDGIQRVRLADQRASLSPREERWVPLLHTGGAVEAALWYYEKGIVFECTDWQWLTNERLREADNGAFALAVVRKLLPKGGVVYFDDAGQGDLEREAPPPRGFWGVAPMGMRIAFAHLMLITVVALYSLGKRFGLPRPAPPRAPALGEYVDALAGVYERTQAVQPAFETILDDVRRRLCRRLGMPAGATLLQLIQALPPDSPLRDALVEAHRALQNPQLTPDEALHLLRRIEAADH
ncbi:DUF4350 domain-containing protein [Synechococcus sp. RC10A2]|uniref:DUF4350 domain-containing protein n=1 Tax=Synechococcus sp. RC10A2 TaxID=2964529 RepID=UPI0039C68A9C